VAGILSIVRNRIRIFALEIEASYPDWGEAAPARRLLPKEVVTQISIKPFKARLQMWPAVMESSRLDTQYPQGDFRTLATFLKEKGVQEADIQELKVAIKEDPPPDGNDSAKGGGMMGKMIQNQQRALEVTTTTGASLLTKAIELHYGMHP